MITKKLLNSSPTNLSQILTNLITQKFTSLDNLQQIKNHNITFDANDWMINLYPFYPQVRKKRGVNIYEISKHQIVLAFVFLDKTMEYKKAWALRKIFTFNFQDCSRFSALKIGSGRQMKFSITSQMRYNTNVEKVKMLTLIDNPTKQFIKFCYKEQPQQKQRQTITSKIKFEQNSFELDLPYEEYRVMNNLISRSLFDLGGWNMKLDLYKNEQMNFIALKADQDRSIDETFYGEKIIQ